MHFKIPFSGRAHQYNKREIDIVVDTMKNGKTLTQGENLINFQRKFSKYLSVENSFALSNAASALELVAQLCQFQDGDEVIIPGHTYTASAYPFLKKGAKIVWADIDLKTRVVNHKTIEKCITKKTKAIVVVHLYGYGADMLPIMRLAKKHNLIVIEDAAQALGVELNKKKIGTFGDFGIFSFHSHKNISTLGEGGMLVLKNKEISNVIPMLRHNGHTDFNFAKEFYWKPAMGNVDLPLLNNQILWPNNYCLGEVECALGTILLDRIDSINFEKRKRANYFINSMSEFSDLEFHKVKTNRHNYHLLVARVLSKKRDILINKLAEEGIQCVVQYYPLYRYDLYKKVGLGKANCPNTDIFFDNMISFPFNHLIKENDFLWMIETIKKTLRII
jgi:perosamine synthetase